MAKIPKELVVALKANPIAKAKFDALAISHQREYTKWIEEAKQEATRNGRAAETVVRLLADT